MIKKKHINERSNTERVITYNPFDLFFSKKIPNGSYVTVGYMKDADVDESPKITGRKSNVGLNDGKFLEYINSNADTMWADDFGKVLNDPAYSTACANNKTYTFSIDGHIVRILKFQYHWADPKSFGNKWAEQAEEEQVARAKAGFGDGYNDYDPAVDGDEYVDTTDDSYDENDWRRKPEYQGTGIRPRNPRKTSSGYRFPTAAPGLYSYSGENPEKFNDMAIRNMLDKRSNQKSGYKSAYYYVAPDGHMEEMPYEFIDFMRSYNQRNSKPKAENVITDQDELDFVNIIKAIRDKYADKQEPTDLSFNKILYINATPVDWNASGNKGERTPMTFVNNRAIYKEYPFLRSLYLNEIIAKFCTYLNAITGTITDPKTGKEYPDEMSRRYHKLERVTEKKKNNNTMNKKKLYESIMKEVSSIVKKHLNESSDSKIFGTNHTYDEILEICGDELYDLIEDAHSNAHKQAVLSYGHDECGWAENVIFTDDALLSDILEVLYNNNLIEDPDEDITPAIELVEYDGYDVNGYQVMDPDEAVECFYMDNFDNPEDVPTEWVEKFGYKS